MPSLADLLQDLSSGEDARAEQAAQSLPAYGEAALQAILELIQSPQPDQRWWGVRALAGFSQPQAGQALATALTDSEHAVRCCAAVALAKRPDATAIPALITLLQAGDSLLARLAGDALAAAGSLAAPALVQALEQPGVPGQAEAARAIALAGDASSIPALYALLDSESTLVQHWASEGLEKLGVGMTFFKP